MILRIVVLLVALVGLYVVWPSLLAEFDRLPEVDRLNPIWFVVMIACEAASFTCLWMLQRLMLRSTRWYAIATAQLSENAVAKLLPGGTAAGEALQYRMLTTAGERPEKVGVALAAVRGGRHRDGDGAARLEPAVHPAGERRGPGLREERPSSA